ncbi:MAG: VanZ family protein [Candidatus Woesearchaeota archaeon]
MKLKIFAVYWLPILLYAGLIFCLSSMPSLLHPDIVPDFTMQDKGYHIIEYFFLSFLILRLMLHYKVKNKYMYAILLATLYGVTDEFHQIFVIGRYFSGWDMLANLVGASLILTIRKLRSYDYGR